MPLLDVVTLQLGKLADRNRGGRLRAPVEPGS